MKQKHGLEKVLSGFEPTGHYWFCLGDYLTKTGMTPVMVNPHHVKKSKELDNNSQSKNEPKDPKIIANLRLSVDADLTSVKNKFARWVSVYFPEYAGIYEDLEAKGGIAVLKVVPIPEEIVKLVVEGIIQIWKNFLRLKV